MRASVANCNIIPPWGKVIADSAYFTIFNDNNTIASGKGMLMKGRRRKKFDVCQAE